MLPPKLSAWTTRTGPGAGGPAWGRSGGVVSRSGQARAFLAAFLGNWERADDAVLLIGELGANAVVHTGSGEPGGLFTVRAVLAGSWLRAEVEDQGGGWHRRAGRRRMPARPVPAAATVDPVRHAPPRHGSVTWFVLDGRHPY